MIIGRWTAAALLTDGKLNLHFVDSMASWRNGNSAKIFSEMRNMSYGSFISYMDTTILQVTTIKLTFLHWKISSVLIFASLTSEMCIISLSGVVKLDQYDKFTSLAKFLRDHRQFRYWRATKSRNDLRFKNI